MNRSPSVFPALFALAGVLLGFALGALSCGPGPGVGTPPIGPALSPPGADPDFAALLREVRALGDRIAELAAARPTTAVPAATPERAPVEGTGQVTTTELSQLLERCAGLVERLERRTGGTERRDLTLVIPGATKKRFNEYNRHEDDAEDRFSSDHLLWSYQQVLDRYGTPDSISTMDKGRVYWRYDLVLSNGDEETTSFYFTDGLVMRGNL